MALQKFTGRIVGLPKELVTTKNERKVVHVRISFMPAVDISGELPEFNDNALSEIQLSFWNEDFQRSIMTEPDALVGKMVTGYCDQVVKREQFYNGTGYAFVLDPAGKPKAPELQVIGTSAPSAPKAPKAKK